MKFGYDRWGLVYSFLYNLIIWLKNNYNYNSLQEKNRSELNLSLRNIVCTICVLFILKTWFIPKKFYEVRSNNKYGWTPYIKSNMLYYD